MDNKYKNVYRCKLCGEKFTGPEYADGAISPYAVLTVRIFSGEEFKNAHHQCSRLSAGIGEFVGIINAQGTEDGLSNHRRILPDEKPVGSTGATRKDET